MSEKFNAGVSLIEQVAPATPAAGVIEIYGKSDHKVYIKDSTGAETDLTATGGGGGGSKSFSY
jgi:hypothetical protein